MFNICEKCTVFIILLVIPVVVPSETTNEVVQIDDKNSTVRNDTSDSDNNKPILLNYDNFDKVVFKQETFVMFYAPWCYYSKELFPTWGKLANNYNHETSIVRVAQVDCDIETRLCKLYKIKTVPSLLYFKPGEKDWVVYDEDDKDYFTLENFVENQ